MKVRAILLLFSASIVIASCSSVPQKKVDQKFTGKWKYYTSSYEKNGKGDGSMDGLVASLNKVEGTNETYSFSFINFDLMFTKKDDSTLQGVDNKFSLKYDESSEHLTFDIGGGSFDEFTKLK
jgi:hypothetical protein